MINIVNIKNENDFRKMCSIESEIAKYSEPLSYSPHPSHLVFDRYMFGSGAEDIFTYGKLIIIDNAVIGYALAYLEYPDETELVVRLLPDFSKYYQAAIVSIIALYSSKKIFSVIVNSLDSAICQALAEYGFICGNEERWQSHLSLRDYEEQTVIWQDEAIQRLSDSDVDERVKYAEIPTGKDITRKMYDEYMQCEYYKNTLDYVIRSSATNEFIGFATWWVDDNSKAAILEPIACLPEYRRRGIAKRALFQGLNELKHRKINHVYISTYIHNEKSKLLYQSVGFQKIGTVCRWVMKREI